MSRQYLTDFELIVLLAVLRLGDDAYGVAIAKEIVELHGGIIRADSVGDRITFTLRLPVAPEMS